MKGGNKSKKRGEVGNQRPERKERERERENERKHSLQTNTGGGSHLMLSQCCAALN